MKTLFALHIMLVVSTFYLVAGKDTDGLKGILTKLGLEKPLNFHLHEQFPEKLPGVNAEANMNFVSTANKLLLFLI